MSHHIARTELRVGPLLGILGACIIAVLYAAGGADAQSDSWERGKLIGLRAGTCIREGPGLNYGAHTRVPENDWTVMVIDGPRQANGKTWYDTSRKAAGDPSGGTGWVMADWSDTDCASPRPVTVAPAKPPPAVPAPNPAPALPGNPDELLSRIRAWWNAQSELVKWLVAIVLLGLLSLVWRQVASALIGLLFAAIEGLILWWVLDQTRALWQGVWYSIVGAGGPDLALLAALIPLVGWLLSLLRRRAA